MSANKKSRQKFLAVLVAVSLVLLMAACEGDNQSQTITSIPFTDLAQSIPPTKIDIGLFTVTSTIVSKAASESDWQYRWLKGVPCQPPCWEGITPGKTNVEEAASLLKQNNFVDPASVIIGQPPIVDPSTAELHWTSHDGKDPYNKAIFDAQSPNHTILYIRPNFNELGFKLGEVIKIYGQPSHVTANIIGNYPQIQFFWFSRGFIVGVSLGQGQEVPEIGPDLIVKGPYFFIPGTPEDWIKGTSNSIKEFILWQGYKDFKFYC